MGFLKKLFSGASDELKKNLEVVKKEICNNLEGMKQNAMTGVINEANSRDDNEEADEESKVLLGNDGFFSDRLEALIAAALQDGVLTDKERELLKRRAEKEGEDWDEVEMILNARLAEIQQEKGIAASQKEPKLEPKTNEKEEELPEKEDETTIDDENDKGDTDANEIWSQLTTILKCRGKRNIVIPEGVKVINNCSFTNGNIESLELPSTLVTIEKMAFAQCKKLKTVDFTHCRHLKEIGESAFCFCEKLEKVDLSRCTQLENIGESSFHNCEELRSIDFPDSVMSIGVEAFSKCNALTRVVLPAALEEIRKQAFCSCEKLEEVDFSLSTRLKRIGEGAFNSCEKLKDIVLPNSVAFIGQDAFSFCNALKQVVLPAALEEIGNKAFRCCKKLEEVDFFLSTRLERIGEVAFHSCEKLNNIVLPDSVTFIGENAFSFCNALKQVVLPASLEKLDDNVFLMCRLENIDMSKVTHLSTIPKGLGHTNTMMIPQGVTTISDSAFYNLSSNKCEKLFLPSTLESYGKKNGGWNAIYLYAPQFEELETLLECNNSLYVLPQYLNAYKELWEALGKPNKYAEILPIPDEYLYYYDN